MADYTTWRDLEDGSQCMATTWLNCILRGPRQGFFSYNRLKGGFLFIRKEEFCILVWIYPIEEFKDPWPLDCQDYALHQTDRITLWAWIWSSSQARVTSRNSWSSRSSLNATPMLDSKSFHLRQNFSFAILNNWIETPKSCSSSSVFCVTLKHLLPKEPRLLKSPGYCTVC